MKKLNLSATICFAIGAGLLLIVGIAERRWEMIIFAGLIAWIAIVAYNDYKSEKRL